MKAAILFSLLLLPLFSFAQQAPDKTGCIGIALAAKNGVVTIVNILPNTPAEKNGQLATGDKIVAVESEYNQSPWVNIENLTLEQVVDLIRGPVGHHVALTIDRDGQSFAVEMERAIIEH